MRFRSALCFLISLLLLLSLAACGKEAGAPAPESSVPGQESEAPSEGAGEESKQEEAAPEASATLPEPRGVDSVKTLLEISLDYFHSGCDYAKIAEYQDPRAYIARLLLEELYDGREMKLEEAMEKAALLYGSAEDLQQKDPELAAYVMEQTDMEDPEEYISEIMEMVREDIRNGNLTKDSPDYEKYAQMLTDWDKGADYIFEHYPEFLEEARDRGISFSLEDAMDIMRRYGRYELYRSPEEDAVFKDLECEYSPENTYVQANGVNSYDMGSVIDGYSSWSADMLYYVRDGLYYLIGYSYAVGGTGG